MHKTINKYLSAAIVVVGLSTIPTTGAAGAVEERIQAIVVSLIDADSTALA